MEDKIEKIARKISGFKTEKTTNHVSMSFDIDKVIIIIEPWGKKLASTLNVNVGGTPHYSIKQIKNLLDRKTPNFELKASSQEKQKELEQEVINCFGSKENLINQLKNIDFNGTFYAQVDNFKPYCDAYHIKNLNGVEIYVKFYIEQKSKTKSDFVIVIRCHKDR